MKRLFSHLAAISIWSVIQAPLHMLILGSVWGGLAMSILLFLIFYIPFQYKNLDRVVPDTYGDGLELSVSVNGVHAGTLQDGEYDQIRQKSYYDPLVFIKQGRNVMYVLLAYANQLLIAIPAGLAWAAGLAFLFAPETFADIAAQLQRSSYAEVHTAVMSLATTIAVLGLMSVPFAFVGTGRLGYVNCFKARVAEEIRRKLGIHADGEISLLITQKTSLQADRAEQV